MPDADPVRQRPPTRVRAELRLGAPGPPRSPARCVASASPSGWQNPLYGAQRAGHRPSGGTWEERGERKVMSQRTDPGQGEAAEEPDGWLLPADPRSAGRARSAVRRALKAWGMSDLSGDTELLASELVANAVEHAGGQPVGFAVHRQAGADGQPAVRCEVSDSSPVLPEAGEAKPDAERGRGLAIVAGLATDSGVRTSPVGKTTWFTLALSRRYPAGCTN